MSSVVLKLTSLLVKTLSKPIAVRSELGKLVFLLSQSPESY